MSVEDGQFFPEPVDKPHHVHIFMAPYNGFGPTGLARVCCYSNDCGKWLDLNIYSEKLIGPKLAIVKEEKDEE